jgi:hypothetical protein
MIFESRRLADSYVRKIFAFQKQPLRTFHKGAHTQLIKCISLLTLTTIHGYFICDNQSSFSKIIADR